MKIWNDQRFLGFTDDGKLAFLFLLTHPHMTSLGAMRASTAGLAAELGWKPEKMSAAIEPAVEAGMVVMHVESSFLWLPNFLAYNEPESPNVVRSWASQAEMIPECPFTEGMMKATKIRMEGMGEGFAKAFREAFPKAYPHPSPNPEPKPLPEPFLKGLCSEAPTPGLQADLPEEAVIDFPIVGKPKRLLGAGGWSLTRQKFKEYEESFPGLDVLAEVKKARQWVLDNPARRKTQGGMAAFLGRWLSKANDGWGKRKDQPLPAGGTPARRPGPPPPVIPQARDVIKRMEGVR